jgi:hypothetical protein
MIQHSTSSGQKHEPGQLPSADVRHQLGQEDRCGRSLGTASLFTTQPYMEGSGDAKRKAIEML